MITFSVLAIMAMHSHLSRHASGRLSWKLLWAVACSELALLAMASGLVVWAVNGVQMLLFAVFGQRRLRLDFVVYIAVALLSISVYLHGLPNHPLYFMILSRPLAFLTFLLVGIGNSTVGYFNNRPIVKLDLVVGFVLTVYYGVVIVDYLRLSRIEQLRLAHLLCLVLLGLGEGLLIGLGRVSYGTDYAASPRYSTLTLIAVAGCLIFLAVRAGTSRVGAVMAVGLGVAVL